MADRLWVAGGHELQCCIDGNATCKTPAPIIDSRYQGAAFCVAHAAAGVEQITARLEGPAA